ncbi:MAG: hypothetical protein HY658_06560 [Actinobacteria bacterium]|nr:hypothetical protein [Actinomycetota bacterium]
MSTRAEDRPVPRCVGCGRELEVCSCCEEPGCGNPLCYPDLAVLARQSMRQPHLHGG